MSNVPLSYAPGVCKVNSPYASTIQSGGVDNRPAQGRITDMDKARFVAGLPEKLAGWVAANSTALTGVPRGIKDWRSNAQRFYLGVGTSSKLYQFSQNITTDITPLLPLVTSTLANPLDTLNASTTVTVHHTSHGLVTGDYAKLVAGAAIGGLTIAGVYSVTVTNANTYTITATSAATSTVLAGGGTVAYSYYRITLTNPFDTTISSATVTVHHTAHGESAGDYIDIAGASAVGGLTLSGNYQIQTVPTADTYTITASSNATSTVSGGGGTPSVRYDIHAGYTDSIRQNGYGTGVWDDPNGYGTTGSTSILRTARVWYLQKYGQQLYSCPGGDTIYIWDPTIAGRSYPLYGAPTNCLGFFITAERFIIAFGPTGTYMTVAWPDQSDPTNWVSTATNTANSGRTLQSGAFLVNGITVRDGVSLVLTNSTCYTFTYSGDNEIYDTQTAGDGSGLIGPLALATMRGVGFWFGTSDLWNWNGNVAALPTDDVRDYIFQDINLDQAVKCVVGTNIAKNEVWFFWPSASATEINRYAIFHIDQSCFSVGTMVRTSWIDRGLFNTPIATDASGNIMNHETGHDDNGAAMDSYFQVSPIEISKGDAIADVFTFIPDVQRQTGNLSLQILSQTYSQDMATVNGPYAIAPGNTGDRIDVRIADKMIGFKIESNVLGGDYRIGLPKVEMQQAGMRR